MARKPVPRYVIINAGPTEVDRMVKDKKSGVFERKTITIDDGFMVKFPASRNKHSIFFETKALLDDFIERDRNLSGEEDDDDTVSVGSEPLASVKASVAG